MITHVTLTSARSLYSFLQHVSMLTKPTRIVHTVWRWISLFPGDFDYAMRHDLSLIYDHARTLDGLEFSKAEFMAKLKPLAKLQSPFIFRKAYCPAKANRSRMNPAALEELGDSAEITEEERIVCSFLNLQAKTVAEQLCLIGMCIRHGTLDYLCIQQGRNSSWEYQ